MLLQIINLEQGSYYIIIFLVLRHKPSFLKIGESYR